MRKPWLRFNPKSVLPYMNLPIVAEKKKRSQGLLKATLPPDFNLTDTVVSSFPFT